MPVVFLPGEAPFASGQRVERHWVLWPLSWGSPARHSGSWGAALSSDLWGASEVLEGSLLGKQRLPQRLCISFGISHGIPITRISPLMGGG